MKYLLWGTFLTEFVLLFFLFIRSSRENGLRLTDRFFCLTLLLSMVHLVMYIASDSASQGQILASTSYLILKSLLHPTLFLVTRQLQSSHRKIGYPDIVHFAPFMLILFLALESSWIQSAFPLQEWQSLIPLLALPPTTNLALLMVLSAIFIGYQWAILKLVWPVMTTAWQDVPQQSAIRWIFFFSVYNILFTILASLFYLGIRINHPDTAPDSGGEVYTLLSSLFTLIFCFFYLRYTEQTDLPSSEQSVEPTDQSDTVSDEVIESHNLKYRHSGLSENESVHYFQMVDELVKSKKLYLEHSLKVADLSSELGLGNSYISQVINQNKGYCFNDYINHYRVETVQAKIEHLAGTGLRVLPKDLGYEAGFGSGSTFYKAFRLITGSTPKQYLITCLKMENEKLQNPENSLQSLEPVD